MICCGVRTPRFEDLLKFVTWQIRTCFVAVRFYGIVNYKISEHNLEFLISRRPSLKFSFLQFSIIGKPILKIMNIVFHSVDEPDLKYSTLTFQYLALENLNYKILSSLFWTKGQYVCVITYFFLYLDFKKYNN